MAGTARQTAARRRNLAKARAARRRRGGSYRSRVNKEYARKMSYAAKHYTGPGSIYKMNSDRRNSRGAYTRGYSGKLYGKHMKRVNKGAQTITNIYGAPTLAVSYVRGRRAGTIKKRKRR